MKTSPNKTSSERADVYARVTERIVAALEKGVRPWLKPWSTSRTGQRVSRPLRVNGTPYRGVNVVLLWIEAFERGFTSSTWMTYRQAQELGGQVRKGEAGTLVVYASKFTAETAEDEDSKAAREIPFMKGYTVFNVDQIDGLPARFLPTPELAVPAIEPIAAAQAFFAATGSVVREGGDQAYYSPAHDVIHLPAVSAFRDAQAHASVSAHEHVHWTGHPKRLAREFGKRFGDNTYAFEELVAELGAAFMCADLGIAAEPRPDHAAYLASWLDVLKGDKRAVFAAAAQAQRAVDYLHTMQPTPHSSMC